MKIYYFDTNLVRELVASPEQVEEYRALFGSEMDLRVRNILTAASAATERQMEFQGRRIELLAARKALLELQKEAE